MTHGTRAPTFLESAPARFGCKQRKACNNTSAAYGGAISTRSGGTPVRKVRAELACLPLSCGTVWSPLAEGPFFNGTLVPKIQLAILKTPKNMSWPRLARPRDLVDSLVWRGDDRATEFLTFFFCPSGGLRSASESPCSACLTPYTQTCPACLPVLLCLLYVVLLFRMLGGK